MAIPNPGLKISGNRSYLEFLVQTIISMCKRGQERGAYIHL